MERELTVIASDATLSELSHTLARPKFDRWVGQQRRMELFARYADSVTMVSPGEVVTDCRDPKDNMFLELALSGRADELLTGDDDLLSLHPWRGIAILSPADYLAIGDGV
jgi:putative PIN family toxin of toxin-antitoxin system